MEGNNFCKLGHVNYKEKSSSTEAEKYNPVDLSSPSSTSESKLSVVCEPTREHVCSNTGHHTYSIQSDPPPSTSHNAVAKRKSKDESYLIQSSSSSIQSIDKLSQDNIKKTDSTNKMSTIISENTNNTQSNENVAIGQNTISSSNPNLSKKNSGDKKVCETETSTPLVIKHGNNSPPTTPSNNPESHCLQSMNVSSSSSDYSVEKSMPLYYINLYTNKEQIDCMYDLEEKHLKQSLVDETAILEARMRVLKARMDIVRTKFEYKILDNQDWRDFLIQILNKKMGYGAGTGATGSTTRSDIGTARDGNDVSDDRQVNILHKKRTN